MYGIEHKQAVIKHEPPKDSAVSLSNIRYRTEINQTLGLEFYNPVLSPVIGIEKLRKVLHFYGLDFPVLYELEPEGDEVVIELNQFGVIHDFLNLKKDTDETFYLYLIYLLNDFGKYEFYAEITDQEGIEDIMRSTDNLEDV